jgi:hypothetical protein
MKKLLITPILVFSFFISLAQNENPYKYFKIANNQFMYEAVFPMDSLNITQIESLLLSNLPMAKSVTNVKGSNGLITANLVNLIVDFKKYGGTQLGTAVFLNSPMNANVSIQIKEGKYKVNVGSIVFDIVIPGMYGQLNHMQTSSETLFLKNEMTEFRTRGNLVESVGYMEQQLNDIFTIKPIKSDW